MSEGGARDQYDKRDARECANTNEEEETAEEVGARERGREREPLPLVKNLVHECRHSLRFLKDTKWL